MNLPADLDALSPEQLRALTAQLIAEVEAKDQKIKEKEREASERDRELRYRQTRIDQLTHEVSVLKRQQFGRRSEQLNSEQMNLLDEAIDGDLVAIEMELEQLEPTRVERPREQPKRAPLPPQLPRTDIHHEPDSTTCQCGCERIRIGEDVSEKLDYTPGVFTVERHIRGKWVCKACETLIQAPVPPHVIDKGVPTAGLLAQVLIAKYGDHLPLYRQEQIFGRAGLAIPRSTLGAWVGRCGVQLQPLVDALRQAILQQSVLHADETPVQMLSPGKGNPGPSSVVFLYELKHDLNLYLRDWARGAKVKTMADIIAFNQANPDRCLRFGQDLFLASQATKGDLSELEYKSARAMDLMAAKQHGLDAYMGQHKLDAVVFPGVAGAAIAAKPGYPSVQVPAGMISGAGDKETPDYPLGLTFTGRAWSEHKLLQLAYAYEQATNMRKPPPGLPAL